MRAGVLLVTAGLSGCLLSCAPRVVLDDTEAVTSEAKEVRYSLVYVIHGDGDYAYHDSDGVVHRADEEAFSGALMVGERSADAEVFIYHQKPRKRFLFFSGDDSDFRYFRRGKPLVTDSYSRDDPDFQEEIRLFRQHTVGGGKTVFLYYGHEVPQSGGDTYDASDTGREFNVASLARAIEGFSREVHSPSKRIDLLVLSTCYNGSPCAIALLAPHAEYIIASPENLHLSHMRNDVFESLDQLNDLGTAEIARRFASASFERLKSETQTGITVVLYDTRKTGRFLRGAAAQCDSLSRLLQKENESATRVFYDWTENPALFREGAEEGVTVLYRPPQFGRMKMKKEHSGWEAWKVISTLSPDI